MVWFWDVDMRALILWYWFGSRIFLFWLRDIASDDTIVVLILRYWFSDGNGAWFSGSNGALCLDTGMVVMPLYVYCYIRLASEVLWRWFIGSSAVTLWYFSVQALLWLCEISWVIVLLHVYVILYGRWKGSIFVFDVVVSHYIGLEIVLCIVSFM